MATAHSRSAARFMIAPAVFVLLVWMLIPLCMTLYFSFADYRPLRGTFDAWIGFDNYVSFFSSSSFLKAVGTTLWMVGGILSITIIGGVLMALLLDRPIFGQGIVRILVIAPFFVMPTVSALVWKNMFFNVDNGLFSYLYKFLGLQPFDFLSQAPLFSIVVIVAWQWLPFATLIL
ncbi:MAG: sugar ABC transporter permease, partial [Paracoccaceae bacterium]